MKVREAIQKLQSMPDDSVPFGYRDQRDGEVILASDIAVDDETGMVVVD